MPLNKPYYVRFAHDRIPTDADFDHTRPNAAPPGDRRQLAGHTRVRIQPALSLVWGDRPAAQAGHVNFYVRSANVHFALTDFAIAISSTFQRASCAYRVTKEHELDDHIYAPIRIFHSYRDVLVDRLNLITLPTETSPMALRPAQIPTVQTQLGNRVYGAVQSVYSDISRDIRAHNAAADTPAAYRLVHSRCTAAQWRTGR